MRNDEDQDYGSCMSHARVGNLSSDELVYLNLRQWDKLSLSEKMKFAKREGPPTIVCPSNAARHAINHFILSKVAKPGVSILRVDAQIQNGCETLINGTARYLILGFGDEKTARLPQRIYIYVGMPVMVTKNVAVELGIANWNDGYNRWLVLYR